MSDSPYVLSGQKATLEEENWSLYPRKLNGRTSPQIKLAVEVCSMFVKFAMEKRKSDVPDVYRSWLLSHMNLLQICCCF